MRIIAVIALLLGLLVLLGMSFLRINNLEHDVSVLAREVRQLKERPAPAASPVDTATPPLPVVGPLGASPAAAAPALPMEAAPRGFLDDGAEEQVLALPARLPRVRVSILAVEGDGAAPRPLAEPIAFNLQAGIPQEVQGICAGPETAAWIFTLEGAAVRITSRDCEYPVRGLRPRLRISAVP